MLSLTVQQKRDPKSKVQSPFKCLHKTTCKSKVGSFFHCLSPPPPPYSLSSSLLPLGVPPVLSFALQVVALRLAPLPAVKARQRLPVFVHAPAVAPPPAFGGTALQRKGEKRISMLLVLQRFNVRSLQQEGSDNSRALTNITQMAPTVK